MACFNVCLFQTAMLFLVISFLNTPVSDKDHLGSLPVSSLPHLCWYISYQNGVSSQGNDQPNTRHFSGLFDTVFLSLTPDCANIVLGKLRGYWTENGSWKKQIGGGEGMWTGKCYLKQMPVKSRPGLNQSKWCVEIVSF